MKIKILTIVIGLLLYENAQARELVIIANKAYPSGNIVVAALKDVYRGEKTVEGGVKIRPIDQEGSVIEKKFLEKVLGTAIDRYKGYWIKRIFQDGAVPPVKKKSSGAVVESVKQEPGLIGYIWKDEVDPKDTDIKVLFVMEIGD